MNSVAPIFESGMVWAPDHVFAEEVIEELAAFPFGEHDDYCDSATMALMRFPSGWVSAAGIRRKHGDASAAARQTGILLMAIERQGVDDPDVIPLGRAMEVTPEPTTRGSRAAGRRGVGDG